MKFLSFRYLRFMALMACLGCGSVAAQTVDVGNQSCTQNYTVWDYYDNGQYNQTTWVPDGVTCFVNDGYNYHGPDTGGSSGSGGDTEAVPGTEGRRVSLDGKRVYARDVACSGDGQEDLKRVAAQHALIKRPNMAIGTVITVYLFENKSQKFVRQYKNTAMDFIPAPNSRCE